MRRDADGGGIWLMGKMGTGNDGERARECCTGSRARARFPIIGECTCVCVSCVCVCVKKNGECEREKIGNVSPPPPRRLSGASSSRSFPLTSGWGLGSESRRVELVSECVNLVLRGGKCAIRGEGLGTGMLGEL